MPDDPTRPSFGADHVLAALPASVLVLDPVGTVLYATAQTAALVGVPLDEFIGSSVLQYVTEDFAWVYAASVAMADDYAGVTMGPLRIAFKGPDGTVRSADLWAENRFDDPEIGGIVCLITNESAAVSLGEAVEAFALSASVDDVARHVVRAMRGAPVMGDAVLVEVGDHTCRVVGDTDVPPSCVADDGPWRTAIDTDIRQLHPDLTQLSPDVAAAAAAAGYAAVWAEPVQLGELTAPLALTIWRRRPGNPSPNQLTHIHQGTSIIAAAWSRQPMSS